MPGFFFEAGDTILTVNLDGSEAASLLRRSVNGRDGDIGALSLVPGQHIVIVHLVNMGPELTQLDSLKSMVRRHYQFFP